MSAAAARRAFDSPVGIRSAAGALESFSDGDRMEAAVFVLLHETNKHATEHKEPERTEKRSRSAAVIYSTLFIFYVLFCFFCGKNQ